MSESPLRLVLDTNVCLDLLLFKDPRVADLAQQLQRGELIAYRDEATVEEWRRVVAYAVWKLSGERQRQLLADFESITTASHSPTEAMTQLPQCRDPDDQKFLQLAASASATALLSKDRDLLKLARICRRRCGFAILSPSQWGQLDGPARSALQAELSRGRSAVGQTGF